MHRPPFSTGIGVSSETFIVGGGFYQFFTFFPASTRAAAAVALLLLSDKASFVTGVTGSHYAVDGGRVRD